MQKWLLRMELVAPLLGLHTTTEKARGRQTGLGGAGGQWEAGPEDVEVSLMVLLICAF